MLRSVEIAEVSFALRRALKRFGMAIAAIIAMIATTIMSSIRVKPLCFFMVGALSGCGSTLDPSWFPKTYREPPSGHLSLFQSRPGTDPSPPTSPACRRLAATPPATSLTYRLRSRTR